MFRNLLIAAAGALITAAGAANAATVTFIPPSDPTGQVFTTNANDAYSQGRGVVFVPTANFSLDSVGIFQNLTNVTLSYSVELASAITGNVGPGTVLRSGSALISTTGLEWIDFNFASLNLAAGSAYNVAFFFNGNANQNFFYNQSGAEPYSQSGFTNIDGFQAYGTSNTVLPGIRLNGSGTAVVPEPGTWLMLVAGFGIVGVAQRRSARRGKAIAA
ncbi:PEPxxWA-CTERM sorting domain-containing protein [Sandarakinorhabdus sp.]|uniref:PEPxxWA-CTERM sorting domain-containing protein n=1 Tax=Sandarakinorhabdus sp. TaxID=1916663 RepID=UPI00286E12DA|nr:PEPxxWA-CTERM sorting domain-containing protein [Sandarakinorhabdus sp.]